MAYTEAMERAVREAAPLTLESAKEVAGEIGVSYRSVIAKAKQLGVEYIPRPAKVAKSKGPTKLELVAEIAEASGIGEAALVGLEKAPKAALEALVARFS